MINFAHNMKSRLFFIMGATLFLVVSSCLSLPRNSRDFFQTNYSNKKVKNAELVLMLSKAALTFSSHYILNKSHNKKELSHQTFKHVRTLLLIRDTVSLLADFCKFLRHHEYGIASGIASLVDLQNTWSLSPEIMKKLPDQLTKKSIVAELLLELFVTTQTVDSYTKLVFEKAVDAAAFSARLTKYDDSLLKRVALGATFFYALCSLLSHDKAARVEMQLDGIYYDLHSNRNINSALNDYLVFKDLQRSVDRWILSPALNQAFKEIDDEFLNQVSASRRDLQARLSLAEHARDFAEERRVTLNDQIQDLSQQLSNVRTRLIQEMAQVGNLHEGIREERARAHQLTNDLAAGRYNAIQLQQQINNLRQNLQAEQNNTIQLQQQINNLRQNLQIEQNNTIQLRQQINNLEQNLQAEQNHVVQLQQEIETLTAQQQEARVPRVLPTIRIGDVGDREGRLSFIVHRPPPFPAANFDTPALPMTINEVQDLRQTAAGDPARDIIVLACNHLLEAVDGQGQVNCPYCREPRRAQDEAIIHLDPHSDQPQQAQWRIAQAN